MDTQYNLFVYFDQIRVLRKQLVEYDFRSETFHVLQHTTSKSKHSLEDYTTSNSSKQSEKLKLLAPCWAYSSTMKMEA
jgi:hypothetical protein